MLAKEKALSVEMKDLEEAYDELSQEGFSTWVRLMTVPDKELQMGCSGLSRVLRINRQSLNRYLKELAEKRYIELVRQPGRLRTGVVIKKVTMVMQPTRLAVF